MTRPNIQIDDLVREMTEHEYAELLATGWTLENVNQEIVEIPRQTETLTDSE